jgi:hypothetical protein
VAPLEAKTPQGEKCITLDGVKVKSKSEKMIADCLVTHGIKYEYEKMIRTWVRGSKISFPDFYLPDYDVYIEYWGMPNDEHYNRWMKWKMAKYYEYGYTFISIYPDNLANFDLILRKKFKDRTGKDLPQKTSIA